MDDPWHFSFAPHSRYFIHNQNVKTESIETVVRVIALFCLLIFSSTANASERVLVSVPPLFSLASILLDGVDKPGLLFPSKEEMTAPSLSPENITRILQADMVIIAGEQFESNIASYVLNNPTLSQKNLTITDSIPTFTTLKKGDQLLFDNPHDMRFWLDPRLAIQAIARMSIRLVTVYPDHYERILDNEAALRKLIKKMEASMRSNLESAEGVPLDVPDSDILYLAWRYNLKVPNCPEAAKKLDGYQFKFGQELYFDMMMQILKDLKACQKTPDVEM